MDLGQEPQAGAGPTVSPIEERALDSLIPYERNPRKNDAAVAKVARSIQEFGFLQPIVVDPAGVILAGHTRLKAAQRLHLATAPTVVVHGLTEEQARAFRIMDNRSGEEARWDEALLAGEIAALFEAGMDMELTGFNRDEWDKLLQGRGHTDGHTPEDHLPDPGPSRTRPGDLWILGQHRILCGDSTDPKVVARLMGGLEADLLWTDPPYNVAYKAKGHADIANDDQPAADFQEFLERAFGAAVEVMRPGAVFYVALADTSRLPFQRALEAAGLPVSQCLVWVKSTATLSRQDYNWRHEPILYGWKPGAGHYFCRDFTLTTVIDESPEDIEALTKAELLDIVKSLLEAPDTVLYEDKPSRNDLHPTMKPVALVRRMVQNSSTRGDAVLDLFGGSGSTLIACEQTSRRAYLVEMEPRYVDAAVKRWEEFTQREAQRAPRGAQEPPE